MGQVRFKSEFYGHSDSYSAEILGDNIDGTPATDAVAEWKALQDGPAPVLLADHLTWLRVHGRNYDSRLLATVADRPGSVMRRSDNVLPVVPLAPFLRQMVKEGEREGSMDAAVQYHLEPGCKNGWSSACSGSSSRSCSSGNGNRSTSSLSNEHRDSNGRGSEISWKSSISHEVNMRLDGRRRRKGRRARDDGRASDADCWSLHLVVDGVVFQVEAAKPKGISRVWANVLPEVSGNRKKWLCGNIISGWSRHVVYPNDDAASLLSSAWWIGEVLKAHTPNQYFRRQLGRSAMRNEHS